MLGPHQSKLLEDKAADTKAEIVFDLITISISAATLTPNTSIAKISKLMVRRTVFQIKV